MEHKELEPVSQNSKGFYGKAWVVKIDPGIEVLESFGRPTALWLDASRQVYLLRGWNVTLTSTAHREGGGCRNNPAARQCRSRGRIRVRPLPA